MTFKVKNRTCKVLYFAGLMMAHSISYAAYCEPEFIHASSGIIDPDDTATAAFTVTNSGIRLTSSGTVTIRYPLNRLNMDMINNPLAGYTDSFKDASIKVYLIESQFDGEGGNYLSPATVKTNSYLLLDSSLEGDQVGHRVMNAVNTGTSGAYNIALDTNNPHVYIYHIKVVMNKKSGFARFAYIGQGVEFNSLLFGCT